MEVARRGPRSGRGGRSRPRQPAYLSWPPPCPRSQPSSGTSAPPAAPTERSMRAPGRPLLLGLLLVLSAAGPGRGFAQPREAAETQTLLRLIAEVVQELKKFHAGESKRLQLLGPQQDPLRGGAGAAGAEEQRAGECAARCGAPRPGSVSLYGGSPRPENNLCALSNRTGENTRIFKR